MFTTKITIFTSDYSQSYLMYNIRYCLRAKGCDLIKKNLTITSTALKRLNKRTG